MDEQLDRSQTMTLQPISAWDPKGANVIFILSCERSGSTMLQVMLDSHSKICSVPEPNVLAPLKYLGYYDHFPSDASFEPLNQELGLREFVKNLPNGEEDYLDACRAYMGHLYRKVTENHSDRLYFIDKTPANVLVWDFLVRLYPRAKYIVLIRHPYAIIDSFARSFFTNDYEMMSQQNTRIAEHICAIADFCDKSQVEMLKTNFETITQTPYEEMERICQFLGIPMEKSVVEYGDSLHKRGVMGDPISVTEKKRPDMAYAWRWTHNFMAKEQNKKIADAILSRVSDHQLELYGYSRNDLMNLIMTQSSSKTRTRISTRTAYQWKRKIYFLIHGWAKNRIIQNFLISLRHYIDLLLRP